MKMDDIILYKHMTELHPNDNNDPNTEILKEELQRAIKNGSITTTKQIDDYKQQ